MIMNTGGTEELATMVQAVIALFPTSTLLAVGFSMGGNVLCKYLGENKKMSKRFFCAVSICQGYDAVRYTDEIGHDLVLL